MHACRRFNLGLVFLFGILLLRVSPVLAETNSIAPSLSTGTALVLVDRTDPILDYAGDELAHFLGQATSLKVRLGAPTTAQANSDWVFRLAIDPAASPTEFSVVCRQPPAGQTVVDLSSADAAGVLHAVYTVLERAGICFDITGPITPAKLDLDSLKDWSCHIRPDVKRRGLRQYLNFPMDLSAYPLSEAKEYVRNVARLRFDLIAFHSYNGIFYLCPELQSLAGSFFYGQRHDLPDQPLFCRAIRNRRTFCIPEIEASFDRPQQRSQAAIHWLNEVMYEAAKCGLTVQFSFEPPGNDIDTGLAAARSILASYPQTRILEMITPENGGHSDQVLARYLKIGERLRQFLGPKYPDLALGIYETGSGLKEGLAFLRKNCPTDITWTFLPAHGARATVDALRKAEITPDEWRRAMIHSWCEFDGLMYLQQNSLVGTRMLIDLARSKLVDGQVPALDFIHWRTVENRTAIRYAALACIDSHLTPGSFYSDYANAMGIGDPTAYALAMADLDDIDSFCRDHLFNIGFCFVGCWTNPKGLGWTRGWKKADLAAASDRFVTVGRTISNCLEHTTAPAGRKYLRVLDNRLRCTTIHLEAIGHLLELHELGDDSHPERLNAKGRELVDSHCRKALELTERYMQLHSQALEDRGCEGTLISYFHTIPPYIDYIRKSFLASSPITDPALATPAGPPAPKKQ
jgi:hypothetical protein